MNWNKVFNRGQHVIEAVIIVLLLVSAITLASFPPTGIGPVAQIIGPAGSRLFFIILYLTQAAMLAIVMLARQKKNRKHVLMFIYLTALFTLILQFFVIGLSFKMIDNLLIGVLAAGSWLRWKFRTEYIDPREFDSDVQELRNDSPPSKQ